MNEPTRRRVLAGGLLVMGLGSGYHALERNDGPRDRTDDGDAMNRAVPVGDLYVEPAVADLPVDPADSSFAVTGEGVFEYVDADEGWQPVSYGSQATPVPAMMARTARVGSTPTGRPLISNGNRTVYVDPDGGDDGASGTEGDPLATVQAAVRRAPIYLRHQFVIDLATVPETPVTYDEDVLVPTIIGTGHAGKEQEAPDAGPFINLVLQGSDEPTDVRIGSVMFGNLLGTSAGNLRGVTIRRDSPYDDEGYGLSAYGNGEVNVVDVRFTDGPTNGVLTYGARMKASRLDFGGGNLAIGFKAKRHSSAVLHEPAGTLSNDAFRATANSTISVLDGRSTSGDPLFNTLRGGLIYDEVSGSWIGLSGNATVDDPVAEGADSRVPVRSGPPADASPGDVWYDDGSGAASEGFYGRTREGTSRID